MNETGSGGRKIEAVRFRDNPRQLGKSRVRLIHPAPLKPAERRAAEARFTGSSDAVARVSLAKMEPRDEERLETVPS